MKWDGSSWSTLGRGLPPAVLALAVFDDGSGTALYAGGDFLASPAGDSFIAKWSCEDPAGLGLAYCFGDGSGTACPCSNAGAAGQGCANGTGQGALLGATGSLSVAAADLVLAGGNLPAGEVGIYFQAHTRVNGGSGTVFGDGLFCAGGPIARLEIAVADPAGNSSTSLDIPGATGLGGGETRTYQLWYRDTVGSHCAAGFNLSNGLELVWQP